MTDFEEIKTGVRRNEQGQIDMSFYQPNYENSPLRNAIKYVSLKKINSADPEISLEQALLYDIFHGKSSGVINDLHNAVKACFNLHSFTRYQEKYNEKLLKSEDGTFYQVNFDVPRLHADTEKYNESEQARIRSFQDDALEEHGIQDKPWANKAYAIAYDRGHSSGFSEVLACLDEPVEFAEEVEKSLNIDFYKRKTKEAYILLKDVIDSLPSAERGKLDWLNPDTELNMKQFVRHVGAVLHPEEKPVEESEVVTPAKPKKKTKAKLA